MERETKERRVKLNAEVRHEAGCWSVYVNGQRIVDRESFAIADRVRGFLERPETLDNSESACVVRSILDHLQPDMCPVCSRYFTGLSGGATGCPVHGIRAPKRKAVQS